MTQALISRWDDDRVRLALSALRGQADPATVSFGRVDGRWDFRGLPLITELGDGKEIRPSGVSPVVLAELREPPKFENVVWQNFDFSHAKLDHIRFFTSEIRDCVFVKSSLLDFREWGSTFANCDFSAAKTKGMSIGAPPYRGKTTLCVDSVFGKSAGFELLASDGKFVGCHFLDLRWKDVRTMSTVFEQCVFTGKLEDVMFDGRELKDGVRPYRLGENKMAGCDFTGCSFIGVSFDGIDTSVVALPNDPKILNIPRFASVVSEAKGWIESDAASQFLAKNRALLVKMLDNYESHLLPFEASGMINIADYEVDDPDEEDSELLVLLRAAIDHGVRAAGVR